jgi:hypothetical protein
MAAVFARIETAVSDYLVGRIGAFVKQVQIPLDFFHLKNSVSDATSAGQSPAVLIQLACGW